MKKSTVVMFLMSFLFSCKDPNYKEIPDKPSNVSNSAIWVGGMKGGTFIDCKNTESIRVYVCDVYGDTGSEFLKGGKYELKYAIWNKEKNDLDYYNLDDKIIPTAYHDIYTSETADIELDGRLVLKPLSQVTK